MDGSGPALHAALGPEVFLLKPSLREFRELTGLPLTSLTDVQAAAQAWVTDKKCQVLVVSLGAHGALMVSGDTVAYAPALPLAVVGAVGAGDSFVAGMLWALTNGHSLTDAFLHGVAAGSASLLSSGTQLCSAEGLFTWLPHVQCFDRAPDVLV
jgi:6-phosphofructokinase 2